MLVSLGANYVSSASKSSCVNMAGPCRRIYQTPCSLAHSKHAFTQHLGWVTAGEQGASSPRWLVECVDSRHAAVEILSGVS